MIPSWAMPPKNKALVSRSSSPSLESLASTLRAALMGGMREVMKVLLPAGLMADATAENETSGRWRA